MHRAAFAAGLLLVLAGAAAWLLSAPPRAQGEPAATLAILSGTVQVTRAGSSAAVAARSGDLLTAGDRVATGPGTRARLLLTDGDESRLDSGTIVVIESSDRSGATLQLLAGRTWNRAPVEGTTLTLTVGGHRVGSEGSGSVFSVSRARAGAGLGADELDRGDPWIVLNLALDLLPPGPGPAAIGGGVLLPGEESTLQQALSVSSSAPTSDLVFTAGWSPGLLELSIIDPAGSVRQRRVASTTPFSLTIPGAEPGGWRYRLRKLDLIGGTTTWFVLVSVLMPSKG